MATILKKARQGVEDLLLDLAGTGTEVTVPTSGGTTRSVRALNAGHLPVTTATRVKTTADGQAIQGTDVDAVLQEILDSVTTIGVPDDDTLEVTSGVLGVKARAIRPAHLAGSAVGEAALAPSAVTTAKLAALAVTAAQLAVDAVTTAKIADGAVTAAKIGSSAVTASKLAADAVGISHLDMEGSGLAPGAFAFARGTGVNVASVATKAVTVTGLLSSDTVVCVITSNNSTAKAYPITTVASAGSFTVTFSSTTDAGATMDWLAFRTTA